MLPSHDHGPNVIVLLSFPTPTIWYTVCMFKLSGAYQNISTAVVVLYCFVEPFFPPDLLRWTLNFGMDSQQVFEGFGRKGSRLRCFVVKLIWPSWNCGQFDGMYVEIGYAWISMVTEEVKGSKYFKILEYPPGFG